MKITVLGSSSEGNCYLLTARNGDTLLLDCGVPYKRILKAVHYNLSSIVGGVISHCHEDHSYADKDLKRYGKHMLKPYEMSTCIDTFEVRNFKIKCFQLVHDVPCFGFLINHPEMGNLVYITDTEYCKYKFSDVDHILVECNYDVELIEDDFVRLEHVVYGHMELQTTIDFLKSNVSEKTKTILLLHASSRNLDLDAAEERIAEDENISRCLVGFAENNMTFELKGGLDE